MREDNEQIKHEVYQRIIEYIYVDSIYDNYRNNMTDLPHNGWVYFIEEPLSKCVKIGYTENIKTRIEALQTGCPSKLKLLWAIRPKERKAENNIHNFLKNSRKQGEWFYPTLSVYEIVLGCICNCFDGTNLFNIQQIMGE